MHDLRSQLLSTACAFLLTVLLSLSMPLIFAPAVLMLPPLFPALVTYLPT